ncbi:hypothetical protein [Opitutus terrae]|nr:hypothetical protein [Opitutus terrae]
MMHIRTAARSAASSHARFHRWVLAAMLFSSTALQAQLVTYHVEAHDTILHSDPYVVDTVVWDFFSPDYQLASVHVRLPDGGPTLERENPDDWFYMWALPGWGFHTDPDFLGWNAEYTGIGVDDPWRPRRTALFGVEFEPNPTLTAALLNAEISYELGWPYQYPPDFVPVPESATWGWLASLLLAAAPALRHRPRRSDC